MARTPGSGKSDGRSIWHHLKRSAITGLALIIPLVVTILVLLFVGGFLAGLITPLSSTIGSALGLDTQTEQYVLAALTAVGLGIVVVCIGLIAETTSGSRLEKTFDQAIGAIPGVGAVYSSFNEMSQMLLDSDTQSFREVVLVEYPSEGSYCVAFLTAETPSFVRQTVNAEEMITVFMPMGPNPFMGGFVLHLSSERVHDVDMTVEEGIRSIVTSGVAMGEAEVPEGETALDHGAPASAGAGGPIGAERTEPSATQSTDDKEVS